MLRALFCLACLATAAQAETAMTAAEFEAWSTGRTLDYFVDGVINFLLTSARPNVESAWFSGADSPYATVRGIAIALLLAFVFLGIICSSS